MSAVIQNEYTQNDTTTVLRQFTFPYLKTSDIKVSLDGVETTAFTLANATTIQFNSVPPQNTKIKIFRQTSVDNLTATFYAGSAIKSEDLNDNFTQNLYKTQEIGGRFISNLGGTMTGDLNMGEDTVIKFEGATDDAHETTLTVADPTADRTITLPNVTGTVVTTGDTGTVATAMIAGDAVNGDKIADNAINSEHYTDGSIDRVHLAADIVDGTKIADDSINSEHYVAGSIDTEHIGNAQVTADKIADTAILTGKLAADAVNGTKIADNSIDSEHYVDGSIDNAHLANNSVTLAKMADDSVGTAELVDGSVVTAALADNSVTLAKMTDNSVGTSEIVNAAVTTAKIAAGAVTTAKIADSVVTTAKLAADAVTNDKLADNSVSTENIQDGDISTAKIADSAVTTAKIASDAVTTVKIANNAITSAKIADDAVGSTELGDGVIDTVHVGAAQITDAKLASNAVTTAKITDANVTTAKIANDAITIGKLGCEQTTISDSDSHIPTSGAVVDYVTAQIAPLGGLEVIATEVAFPNTQPSSGVVISISDAGGVVVNGSGQSTTGRTVGGSTVTINGFPASLQSKTMAADIGLMVSSTGSGQIYNYHKILAKEADVEQLSNDINDFAARYRVGSSNPTSSLDNGDLFFNTGTGKMLVYNGTNTAWEEVQSIGNFFISTLSPAFNGSLQNFTLSNAPSNVQQVLLSINGVIQKPNAGTSTPSEGFALDGSTVKLAAPPASGSDYFAIVMGSTVNIGTPSNNTVSTAVLQDDAVNSSKIAAGAVGSTELAADAVITSKIADDAVTTAKIADNAVVASSINATSVTTAKVAAGAITDVKLANNSVATSKIPDGAVTLAKLENGTGSNNGKFLRANNGAAPTYETVNTDLVSDTSPQLGGNLDTNGNHINITDDNNLNVGASSDLYIKHSSSHNANFIVASQGDIEHHMTSSKKIIKGFQNSGTPYVSLYQNGNEKLRTRADGVTIFNELSVGTSDIQSASVASFVGGQYNQVNIADGSNTGWGLLLAQQQGTNSSSLYTYSTNSSTNKPCSVVNVNNDALHFGTNNTARFRIEHDGHVLPSSNNAYDLGSTGYRWRNVYTNDLHLSNEGHSNDVDGSWGDWTIQEGESDLFLKNNRSGKKYKFNLTEVS